MSINPDNIDPKAMNLARCVDKQSELFSDDPLGNANFLHWLVTSDINFSQPVDVSVPEIEYLFTTYPGFFRAFNLWPLRKK